MADPDGEFLEDTVPGDGSDTDAFRTGERGPEPEIPASIGRYRVMARLGAGGMGVVFAAYDVDLDRKVAIKLVAPERRGEAADMAEQLLREAQAQARVEHPHVVRVYEVGNFRGQVYLVMEFLDGVTLRVWLARERRSWREVLRVLLQAGRGLQAAHDAGVVHRDFKPENVMVDAAGNARVVDFGLAQAQGGRMPADERLAGTPTYMAPELFEGTAAGAASDQYSFAVTAWEALHGERPGVGDRPAGGARPVPTRPPPSRVDRVIVRGLAERPGERWPDMSAMLAAIERGPWRKPLRADGFAAALVAGGVASRYLVGGEAERCDLDRGPLAGVWDETRARAVEQAFAATNLSFATDVAGRLETRLDDYADAWLGVRRTACEEHASGVITTHLADLQVACLDRRKAQLAALVDVFAGAADRPVVENAIQAVEALPSPRACADASELLTVVPPADPAVAARVDVLRAQLLQADALEATGHYDEGLAIASRVREEAATLGYGPLDAEAALSEGRLLIWSIGGERAEAALAHAIQVAIVHDLHRVAAEAAVVRIYVLSNDLKRSSDALATAPFARALVRRASDTERIEILLHSNLGIAQDDAGGGFEPAREEFERGLEVARRRGIPDPVEGILHNNFGNLLAEHGHFEDARAHYVRARELFTELLGPAHPLVVVAQIGEGAVAAERGDLAAAEATFRRMVPLIETSLGIDHRYLIEALAGLGYVYVRQGRAAEAQPLFTRVIEIAGRQGFESEGVGVSLEGLADAAAADGKRSEARELYERAVRSLDAIGGSRDASGARAALRAGELAEEAGEREAAIVWYERVLAKEPGLPRAAEIRPRAALRLALALADRADAAERVCALLADGRAELPASDPLRRAADELAARRCPGG